MESFDDKKYCSECEDQPAEIYCDQCQDDYCEVCFGAQHKKGYRSKHTFQSLKKQTEKKEASQDSKQKEEKVYKNFINI